MKSDILNRNLEKLEADFSETKNPKYKEIQCVALNIGTKYGDNGYYGFFNPSQDAKSRVDFINEVIEDSLMSHKINRSSNCLKIFMIPEFFFRGVRGAYDMETSIKIIEQLRFIVSKAKYKDWLFIFGTTIAYSKANAKEAEPKFTVYNFSFVQKGNKGEKDSVIVLKKNKSGVDFISPNNSRPGMLNSRNTCHLDVFDVEVKRNEEKKINYDGASVFEIDGIQFGLEICLDNIAKRIDTASERIKNGLDVLLITSCGVNKPRMSKELQKKGLVFFVDGKDKGKSCVLDKNGNSLDLISKKRFIPQDKDLPKKLFNSDCSISVFKSKDIKKDREISF